MNLRKLLLFASTALAATAMLAPATAQANGPNWRANGQDLQGELTFEAHGALSFTAAGFQIGPCETHIEGKLFNGETMGEGLIESATITNLCGSNIPKCVVTSGTTNIEHNEQGWPLTAVGSDELEVSGIVLLYHFQGATCPQSTVGVFGTLSGGTFNQTTQCIEYTDDLDLTSSLGTGKVNGSLCLTGEAELELS